MNLIILKVGSSHLEKKETDTFSINPIPHGVFWITHTWGGRILPGPVTQLFSKIWI